MSAAGPPSDYDRPSMETLTMPPYDKSTAIHRISYVAAPSMDSEARCIGCRRETPCLAPSAKPGACVRALVSVINYSLSVVPASSNCSSMHANHITS